MDERIDVPDGGPALEPMSHEPRLAWTEVERLDVLYRYDILDTAPEQAFDDIVRVAAQVCRAPMAAVSLIDEARTWFKAEVGLNMVEAARDASLCAHAIKQNGLVVVPDASIDPVLRHYDLVTGPPHLRFYAGAVLNAPEGPPLGSLCVIDIEPRPQGLDAEQAAALQALGRQVVTQLELRRVLAAEREAAERFKSLTVEREREQTKLLANEDRLHLAMEAGLVGAWEWDMVAELMYGDAQIARTLGRQPDEVSQGVPAQVFREAIYKDDRVWVMDSIRRTLATGGDFAEEYRIFAADDVRWILCRGRTYRDATDQLFRCAGIWIDITDRKRTEEALKEANTGRELAMQAARLGRWDHHPSSGRYFWDARCCEILGAPNGPESLEKLIALIHPEDRERIADALDCAISPDRIGGYAEEYRIVVADTGEVRWLSALGRSMFEDGRCVRFVGVMEDVTGRKQAEAHQRLLTNELNHRVKNTLAMVQALVSQTLRMTPDPRQAREAVTERLIALGRTHDILTRTSWSAAPIDEVVSTTIRALGVEPERIRLSGPARRLAPRPALSLAMAIHELGVNALKYGALSNDTGDVEVAWSVGESALGRTFQFRWSEHGGPPVHAPAREGFGSRLIRTALPQDLKGDAALAFAPTGVVWTLETSLSAVEDDEAG